VDALLTCIPNVLLQLVAEGIKPMASTEEKHVCERPRECEKQLYIKCMQ